MTALRRLPAALGLVALCCWAPSSVVSAGPPAEASGPAAGESDSEEPGTDRAADAEQATVMQAPRPDRPEKGVGREELRASSSVAQATQGQDGLSLQTMCTNCNEANLDLGGFGDEHIQVSRDGYRLSSGLPRIYAFSILPTQAVEKLEIDPGPGLAEYPADAIGGTVNIQSELPEKRPGVHVALESGSFGWNKQAVLADGKIGFFSSRVAATRSHFDPIDADGDGNVETGETDQWTGLVEMGFDLKKGGNLSVGANRIHDEQIDGHGQVARDPSTRAPVGYLSEDTFLDWTGYRVGYDVKLPGDHGIQFRVSGFDRDQQMDAPPFSGQPKRNRYDILQENRYGELKWGSLVGSRWKLSAGLSAEEDVNTVGGGSMPIDLQVLEESIDQWGAFYQATVEVDKASLTLGARYDDFEYSSCRIEPEVPVIPGEPRCQEVSGSEWSPRASLTWKPLEKFQTRTSFGYGVRVPRPVFSEICCGQSPERNSNVRPERSESLTFDFTYQVNPELKLNAYLHRSDFEDYIIKMAGESFDLVQTLVQGNVEDATFEGVTGFVSWKAKKGVALSGSYTWLDARNDGDAITLTLSNDEVTLPLSQIPYVAERRGQLALSYARPKGGTSLQLLAQFTGPMLIQHYLDVPGGLIIGPSGPIEIPPPGGVRPDYLETDDFWTLNLSGRFRIQKHLDLVLGVDNLLDYVQDDLDDFLTDYNWGPIRGRYYYGGIAFRY